MSIVFPDTNVVLRYLLNDNRAQFEKILPLFEDIKKGRQKAILLPEVLLEAFYVLTKVYDIPRYEAGEALRDLLLYKGILNKDRMVLIEAFELFLKDKGLSLLDCFLCIKCKKMKGNLLTFDKRLKRECS